MTEPVLNSAAGRSTAATNAIEPLPGEVGIPSVAAQRGRSVSWKGLLAVALLIASLLAASVMAVQRRSWTNKEEKSEAKFAVDRPAAANKQLRKLELTAPSSTGVAAISASGPAASVLRIPALMPTADEATEPIGIRRTGQPAASSGARQVLPEDAPAMLVSSRLGTTATMAASGQQQAGEDAGSADTGDALGATTRNLQGYQRQLQGLMDGLTRSTASATGQAAPARQMAARGAGTSVLGLPGNNAIPLGSAPSSGTGLLGGQFPISATPMVAASMLGTRSLLLPKGTSFTCALTTRIVTSQSGLVGCVVQRNVYSEDGRVLLVERGSHMDGEYRMAGVRSGAVRIPVLWTRIRTPVGVTVDLDSPATGQLGESGMDGHVDNRWTERIGAALLLSLIDDSVKLIVQNQSNDAQGSTLVLPSTTASTSKLAEKVLDSTINIPPLIYQNQGGIVGIYVARDLDFSTVYALQPIAQGERP